MKKYLIIDTSTTDSAICLLLGQEILIQKSLPQMNQTKEIIPTIKELLKKNNLTLQDLSAIAICTGPGLFTGTRVGVMTAKSLSFASDVPLIPFSSFDLFQQGALYSALDAKCGRVHLFHDGETTLVPYDDLAAISEAIHVLEIAPFAHLPIEIILNKKDYKTLYEQLDHSLPQSHNKVVVSYDKNL